MTDPMTALRGLMEKSADADLLRGMIDFAAGRPMELEVGGLTGAAHGERSAECPVQRNGYRSVDDLVKAMGSTGISKGQVSRLCDPTGRSRANGPISGSTRPT